MKGKIFADRFREVMLHGTLIAYTNYKNELDRVSWEVAVKEVKNLNTIALLSQHIHYYIAGIKWAIENGALEIRDQYSFDFPPMTNEEQWITFKQKLYDDSEALSTIMENTSDDKLNAPFFKEEYGNYARNYDVMIEHAYYHLGQIVMLKKLLTH